MMDELCLSDLADRPDVYEQLLEGVRAGDAGALDQFIRLFNPVLCRHIHARLTCQDRRRAGDTQDVADEVWLRVLRKKPYDKSFPLPQQLAAYLMALADDGLRRLRRRQHAQKRDVRREVAQQEGPDLGKFEVSSMQPGPLDEAIAEDEWACLVNDLLPPWDEVLRRRRAGEEVAAIARALQLCEKTVRRFLVELQQRRALRQSGRPLASPSGPPASRATIWPAVARGLDRPPV